MSVNAKNFRELIVRAALSTVTIRSGNWTVNLWSPAAEELLMLTAAQESHLGEFLRQGWRTLDDGLGVGLGAYSMEPATHADIWRFITQRSFIGLPWMWQQSDDTLVYNLRYATVMARLKYLQAKPKLPAATDVQGMAEYWDEFYNGNPNTGFPAQAVDNYKKYVST